MRSVRPLPKGRHGLSREQIARSQRTRLLEAAVALGAERGFASLTLADIVGRAGVARSTFYEYFADKEECFLEAFDHAADRVIERVFALEAPPQDGSGSLVHGYVGKLLKLGVEEPGLVQLTAMNVDALGPHAVERQRATRSRLADHLVQLRELLRRDDPRLAPISHVRALAIGGAVAEVVQHAFYSSGIDALPALQAELSAIVLALLEAPPA